MWPVTDRFLAAVQQSHEIATLAEVINGSDPIATLAITDGSVDVDETRAIRTQCALTLTDPDGTLTPKSAKDLLHPSSGNELRLWRGVTYHDKTTELVPLGVFRLSKPSIKDGPSGLTISINGYDRARKVQRNRWDSTLSFSPQTVDEALFGGLLNRCPEFQPFALEKTDHTIPRTVLGVSAVPSDASGDWNSQTNDPWADFDKFAAVAGQELFFDRVGVPTSRGIPNPNDYAVVRKFIEGPSCVVTDLQRDLDEDQTYNGIVAIATGSNVPAPLFTEIWDDDPNSPTYYLGPYGKVPYFWTTSLATTQDQLVAGARAKLLKILGTSETLQLSIVPNPALDVGDSITVQRARAGVTGVWVVSTMNIPLSPGNAMSIGVRSRQLAAA